MSAITAPPPMGRSRVDVLVDAWRAADARYGLLADRRSLGARMLLCALLPAATVLLAAWIGTLAGALLATDVLVLAVIGLHAGLVEVADAKVALTWYALRDYTGLSDMELERLVRDDDEIEEVA